MFSNLTKEIVFQVKGHIMKNWGSPFILGFMVFLLLAATGIITSDFAYYSLVVGILLQLICFLKYGRNFGDKTNAPS
jgi:hypothetical protein